MDRGRRNIARILVLGASMALACATPPIPTVGVSAPERFVVRASQYAFTTDFPVERQDPLILDLLELRDEVGATLRLPLGDRIIRVIIFDDQQGYRDFLRRSFPDLPNRRAFFVKLPGGQLAVFAVRGASLRADLRHEATHALLHATLPAVPIWLDEGLAQYFEAGSRQRGINGSHVARLSDRFAFDHDARAHSNAGRKTEPPGLESLESLTELRQMSPDRYRESWLWVHYCLHHSSQTRQALSEHLAALRRGRSDSLGARIRAIEPAPEHAVALHLAGLTIEMARRPGDEAKPR